MICAGVDRFHLTEPRGPAVALAASGGRISYARITAPMELLSQIRWLDILDMVEARSFAVAVRKRGDLGPGWTLREMSAEPEGIELRSVDPPEVEVRVQVSREGEGEVEPPS